MENIIPVIDTEKLQQKANEYAQQGAEKMLQDFYTGYDSPYVKALKDNLEGRGFNANFELPDVIAEINTQLSTEIDKIANTAISKTYLPLVTHFLTRAKPKMNLSDILKEVIEMSDFNHNEHDYDDYEISLEDSYPSSSVLNGSFFDMIVSFPENEYTVHLSRTDKSLDKKEYKLLGLPRNNNRNSHGQMMKLSLDAGATLEIPFNKDILHEPFISFTARLLMAETKITMDVDGFHEDMFPERECYCD